MTSSQFVVWALGALVVVAVAFGWSLWRLGQQDDGA